MKRSKYYTHQSIKSAIYDGLFRYFFTFIHLSLTVKIEFYERIRHNNVSFVSVNKLVEGVSASATWHLLGHSIDP